MNCLEFRRIVGAEPHSALPEVAAHAAECAACAGYQRQLQQMDQLIHRALAVEVDRLPLQPAVRRRRSGRWAMAASVLLAIAVGVFWAGYPRDTLASAAVDHALHEPASLQATTAVVSEQQLAQVLAQSRVRLKSGVEQVSYATNCPFRGRVVPHFVVQTSQGPVTVLLLRDEAAVSQPRPFNEGSFQGSIVPAPHGVLAVLGQGAPVEEVAAKVLAAVEYED